MYARNISFRLKSNMQSDYTRTFETIPLLIVASLWYVLLTTLLTAVQRYVEHRVGRSHTDSRASVSASFGNALWQGLFGFRRPRATTAS